MILGIEVGHSADPLSSAEPLPAVSVMPEQVVETDQRFILIVAPSSRDDGETKNAVSEVAALLRLVQGTSAEQRHTTPTGQISG